MNTMNAFHTWLTHKPEIFNPYQQGLAQLMHADKAHLSQLKVDWDGWAVDPT